MSVRILALAGNITATCYTKKLMQLAIEAARQEGAEVTVLDCLELDFPHFSLDAESLPQKALDLKRQLQEHQGLMIGAPELNGSICTTLKSVLDWGSRPGPGGDFEGKIGAILSGSKHDHGGLRGLDHLRTILAELGVTLIPQTVSLPHAREAFKPDGDTINPVYGQKAREVGRALVAALR